MSATANVHVFTTIAFMAVICTASAIQTVTEMRRSERPHVLSLFDRLPNEENLRAFERNLEEESIVGGILRPFARYAQFALLSDAGEKAVAGRDGWLFYRPGYEYLTQRESTHNPSDAPTDPLPAIVSFRDQLCTRGIRLIVVPVPNKESVHPEMLTSRADRPQVVICHRTRRFLEQARAAGIEVIDLFEVFRQAKLARTNAAVRKLYLAHDTHWSPEGMQLAAQAVAQYVVDQGYVAYGRIDYDRRPAPIDRIGDILEMMQTPQLERHLGIERCNCEQVVRASEGSLYQDEPQSQVLVLGDSFLRVFEQDEPRGAGFVAHLAHELQQPLTSVINDGGGSTLVRQELARRPTLLENKRLVIWEFVERDIRDGTEGWQEVDMDR